MHRKYFTIPLFLLALISCNTPKEKNREVLTDKKTVFVSNYPLYYFASRIAGDSTFNFIHPEFNNTASLAWSPNAEYVAKLQNVDLIVFNGAGFESWKKKYSLPTSIIVNTSLSFENELIKVKEVETHSHGGQGAHAHYKTASTTWLNFSHALSQAQAIKEALENLNPENKPLFEKNFSELKSQLEVLHKEMKQVALRAKEKSFIFSSVQFEYLKSGYSLKGHTINWSSKKAINDHMKEDFKQIQGNLKSKYFIWDSPTTEANLSFLKSQNIIPIILNTGHASSGDFLEEMEGNIQKLNEAIDLGTN